MIVDPDQEYQILYKEGRSCQSGSASFCAKGAPSLNVFEWSGSEFYELSCWILLVKPSGSNILHDILIIFMHITTWKAIVGKVAADKIPVGEKS